jgi:uncharacterized protein YxeA
MKKILAILLLAAVSSIVTAAQTQTNPPSANTNSPNAIQPNYQGRKHHKKHRRGKKHNGRQRNTTTNPQ